MLLSYAPDQFLWQKWKRFNQIDNNRTIDNGYIVSTLFTLKRNMVYIEIK